MHLLEMNALGGYDTTVTHQSYPKFIYRQALGL